MVDCLSHSLFTTIVSGIQGTAGLFTTHKLTSCVVLQDQDTFEWSSTRTLSFANAYVTVKVRDHPAINNCRERQLY